MWIFGDLFTRKPKSECDHEFERWTLNKQRFFLIGRGWVEDVSNPKFPKPVLRCIKCEGIVLRDDVIRVVMEVSYDMPIEQGCDSGSPYDVFMDVKERVRWDRHGCVLAEARYKLAPPYYPDSWTTLKEE